jgi:predicted dehydrogenase
VSVVGDVGLGLQREKMYAKELDLRISRSYGPGRYDPDFELRGRDYPLGYVRWTETRNLEFFLSLLAMGRLSLRSLLTERYPVDQSAAAYAGLKENRPDCYGVLFDYAVPERAPEGGVRLARILETSPPSVRIGADRIRLGLIGVGGHARAVHVPALRQLADRFEICGVASRSTAGAATGAKLTGARMVATDYRELLHHPEVDAVLIATRHASHARIVLEALEAGKHVFVEKPMAVSVADAQAIQDRAVEMGRIVRVGFNRRFAPYLNLLRSAVGTSGRRVLSCRVNVGAIRNDWSNTPEEGGRLLGEGVHFMDLFNWFMGAEPVRLVGMVAGPHDRTNPNVTVSVQYPDGDVAQLVYTSLGTSGFGKEFYEAFGGGRAGRMEDFRTLEIVGASVPARRADRNDKGQRAELEEFAAAVRGETYPIAGADARAGLLATWMVLAAYQSAAEGRAIERAV